MKNKLFKKLLLTTTITPAFTIGITPFIANNISSVSIKNNKIMTARDVFEEDMKNFKTNSVNNFTFSTKHTPDEMFRVLQVQMQAHLGTPKYQDINRENKLNISLTKPFIDIGTKYIYFDNNISIANITTTAEGHNFSSHTFDVSNQFNNKSININDTKQEQRTFFTFNNVNNPAFSLISNVLGNQYIDTISNDYHTPLVLKCNDKMHAHKSSCYKPGKEHLCSVRELKSGNKLNGTNTFNISKPISTINNVDLSKFFTINFDESNSYSNNGKPWTTNPIVKFGLKDLFFEEVFNNKEDYKVFKSIMSETVLEIEYKTNFSNETKLHTFWDGKQFNNFIVETNTSKTPSNKNFVEFSNIYAKNKYFKQTISPASYFTTGTLSNIVSTSTGIKYNYLFNTPETTYNYDFEFSKDVEVERAIKLPIGKFISDIFIEGRNDFIDGANGQNKMLAIVNQHFQSKSVNTDLFGNLLELSNEYLTQEDFDKMNNYFKEDVSNHKPNNYDGIFYAILSIKDWLYENETESIVWNDQINKWEVKGSEYIQGKFSPKFKEELINNKDICYLGAKKPINNSGTYSGKFAIRFKTDKVIPRINPTNDAHIVNYTLHSDYINDVEQIQLNEYSQIINSNNDPFSTFSIDNNDKSFYTQIKNAVENKNNWAIKEIVIDNNNNTETVKQVYDGLDLNKEFEINLKSYNFDDLIKHNDNKFHFLSTTIAPSVEEQKQVMRHNMWNRPINNADPITGKGNIVDRVNTGEKYFGKPIYYYKLNEQYDDYATQITINDQWITQKRDMLVSYKIFNKYDLTNKSFTYKTTFKHLLNMYSIFNKGDASEMINNNPKFYINDYQQKANYLKVLMDKESENLKSFNRPKPLPEIPSIGNKEEQSANQKNSTLIVAITIPIVIILTFIICLLIYTFRKRQKEKLI